MAACVVLVGGALTATAEPLATCSGYVLLDRVDYSNWITGLTNWSYDADLALIGFQGAVLCWVAGVGVGLCIAMVRKLRFS